MKKRLLLIVSLITVMILSACSSTDSKKTLTEDNKENENWEVKVEEIASSDETESNKFDSVEKYARDYNPTKEEISGFEDYIIKEYKDKKYIVDISNHEYMLKNIFKSVVIERYYDEKNSMKDFAFDFYQNSKYNYRGVDTIESEATIANENQMDRALKEMNK